MHEPDSISADDFLIIIKLQRLDAISTFIKIQ